jgi:predicted nucleic acid-binding protein
MVAFDSTFLTFLFIPNAQCDTDRAKERVDNLIGSLQGSGERIVIPSPALAELLIAVGHSRSQILRELTHSPKFLIAPFDSKAALELSLLAETARKQSGKKKGDSGGTWAKVKFDWQIVAISKAQNVRAIYSEDSDIKKLAPLVGIAVNSVADLPLPPTPYSGTSGGLFD